MNLISCYENCIYQYDGSCKLTKPSAVSLSNVTGCSYYRPRKQGIAHKTKTKPKIYSNFD